MPHTTPDCVFVCVWVSVGVFAQICVHATFHVCAVKCRSVCVVCRSPCCLLCPLCVNAVETLVQQIQPQADWVQGGRGVKEDGRVKGGVLACYILYVQTLLVQDQILHVCRMPFPLWQFCFLHPCV